MNTNAYAEIIHDMDYSATQLELETPSSSQRDRLANAAAHLRKAIALLQPLADGSRQ